jgi:hypothetical protein
MSIVTFAPAVRQGTHVIITAYGMSGCGKTLSLLLLGRGLAGPKGRLALLDTETGRGKIYAKRIPGGYDYAELTPPFTPERYVEAVEAAEDAGIDVLVLDSGSHEWEGLGGVLEMADAGRSRSDKPLEGLIKWAKPKAAHKRYVHRLLNSRMHLLISLRAKEKMRQLTAKDTIPPGMRVGDIVSEGFAPIQDKRFVFETTVQLFLPLSDRPHLGVPVVEKCPEDLLGAFPDGAHIGVETGQQIGMWVEGAEPVDHAFLALKLGAEAAAGEGKEALRSHWRTLSKAQRDHLASEVDNLSSIAAAADREAEERARERSNGHKSFQSVDEETGEVEEEDALGLRPLAEPASAEGAEAAEAETVHQQSLPTVSAAPSLAQKPESPTKWELTASEILEDFRIATDRKMFRVKRGPEIRAVHDNAPRVWGKLLDAMSVIELDSEEA